MKVIKVFNNNVSLVLNDSGHEEIIMGKGVGCSVAVKLQKGCE
ncbi:CAT RNA binding domain-containing protein [Amedibacterium intestinale]